MLADASAPTAMLRSPVAAEFVPTARASVFVAFATTPIDVALIPLVLERAPIATAPVEPDVVACKPMATLFADCAFAS
ncbi:hypothetical protein J2W39_003321 [Variovorax paradoxus]|uniref:Uncharacterized protein n=1 Tax=Variovorax paradoxus TaxID=34073 RepID=A0AAW8EIK8_VARPD|nr:hypothetical protein [Variovorax paradoxus]